MEDVQRAIPLSVFRERRRPVHKTRETDLLYRARGANSTRLCIFPISCEDTEKVCHETRKPRVHRYAQASGEHAVAHAPSLGSKRQEAKPANRTGLLLDWILDNNGDALLPLIV